MKILVLVVLFSGLAQAAAPQYPFTKYMNRYYNLQLQRIFLAEEAFSDTTLAQAIDGRALEIGVEKATSEYSSLVEEINKEGGVTHDVRRQLILRQATQLASIMGTPPENLSAADKTRFLTHFYLLLIASDGTINKRLSTQLHDLLPPGDRLADVQTRQTESSRMFYGLGLNVFFLGGIAEFYAAFGYGAPLHVAGDLHLAGSALAATAFYKLSKLSNQQVFDALDKVNYVLWRNADLKLAIKTAANLAGGETLSEAAQVRWFFGYFENFYTQQIHEAATDAKNESSIDCSNTLEKISANNLRD